MMKNRKAVVLLSGGLDSAVCLYLCRQSCNAHALIFDYGQRHKREIRSAIQLAQSARIPYQLLRIQFPWKGSALFGKTKTVPRYSRKQRRGIPVTYVPGRNGIFLSYAFSYAEVIGAQRVYIGAHIQDYSGYPDCRPEFLRRFEQAMRKGLKANTIKISAPLLFKRKHEIIKTGIALGVPFEMTWSCYEGRKKPCLMCDSCFYRLEGFRKAGCVDPLMQ